MSPKARRLGAISIVETLSFVALLWAMLTHNDRGVSILGAIHGVLFLAYAVLLWIDRDDLGWTTKFAVGCVVTGPIGPIVVLERLKRESP